MNLPFSWLDLVVFTTVAIFVLRNAWIGFFRGLSSLLGLVAGYLLASRLSPKIKFILAPWINSHWLEIASFAVSFLLGFLTVFILIELLVRVIRSLRLGWLDHFLGALLGFLKGSLVVIFLFMLLVSFFPTSKGLFKDSLVYPYLTRGARFLVQVFPPKWKSKFNYNLRHYLRWKNEQQI